MTDGATVSLGMRSAPVRRNFGADAGVSRSMRSACAGRSFEPPAERLPGRRPALRG